MHTIKGSSAMMEFNSISTIAHRIEDVFFYIRDKGIETLDPEHKKEDVYKRQIYDTGLLRALHSHNSFDNFPAFNKFLHDSCY